MRRRNTDSTPSIIKANNIVNNCINLINKTKNIFKTKPLYLVISKKDEQSFFKPNNIPEPSSDVSLSNSYHQDTSLPNPPVVKVNRVINNSPKKLFSFSSNPYVFWSDKNDDHDSAHKPHEHISNTVLKNKKTSNSSIVNKALTDSLFAKKNENHLSKIKGNQLFKENSPLSKSGTFKSSPNNQRRYSNVAHKGNNNSPIKVLPGLPDDSKKKEKLSIKKEKKELGKKAQNILSVKPLAVLEGSLKKSEPSELLSVPAAPLTPITEDELAIEKNYSVISLRHMLHYYHLTSLTTIAAGNNNSILYNFVKVNQRINTLDSFEYLGDRLKNNASLLLKSFFKSIGNGLIGKPFYTFQHNKVIIHLTFFLNNKVLLGNTLNAARRIRARSALSSPFNYASNNKLLAIERRLNKTPANSKGNKILKKEQGDLFTTKKKTGGFAVGGLCSSFYSKWKFNRFKKDFSYLFSRKKRRIPNFYNSFETSDLNKFYYFVKLFKKKNTVKKIFIAPWALVNTNTPELSAINRDLWDPKKVIPNIKNSTISHLTKRKIIKKYFSSKTGMSKDQLRLISSDINKTRNINFLSNIAANIWKSRDREDSSVFTYNAPNRDTYLLKFPQKKIGINLLKPLTKKEKAARALTAQPFPYITSFSSPSVSQYFNKEGFSLFTKSIEKSGEYFLLNRNKKLLFTLKTKLNALTYVLEKFFNCSIQLELSRLRYPYSDPSMLADIISESCKSRSYHSVIDKIIINSDIFNPRESLTTVNFTPEKKNSLVSCLSGIKIKIAGRYPGMKIIPRKTVYTKQEGSLAREVISFKEKSVVVGKTKRGSFCLSITVSHSF